MVISEAAGEALTWIVGTLRKHDIPFEVTGGFAGIVYGSGRPLADIDFDVPEDRIPELVPHVRDYIVYGPEHYVDDSWDLTLMTLNYKGQPIDIGGAFQAKVCDPDTKEWFSIPSRLECAEIHNILGMDIPVVNPHDYIHYKRILRRVFEGKHIDVDDAAAVERYLKTKA